MFGAKMLAAVGLEAVQRIRQGMEGSDCGAGAEFVLGAAIRFVAIAQRLGQDYFSTL